MVGTERIWRRWNLVRALLFTALCLSCAVPSFGQGRGERPVERPAEAIRHGFDEAMKRPLAERVPQLEQLEARLEQDLFTDRLSGQDRRRGLYYLYHTRMQLAKHPEACATYGRYIQSVREEGHPREAKAVLLRDLNRWESRREHAHVAAICEQVREMLAEDGDVAATALYHQARSTYRLPGRLERCQELLEHLVSEHADSRWHGPGLRLLANVYFGRGNYNAALSTLELLKQRHGDTKLEHYADMRPAAIWELRGEPQRALSIYQQTLERYTDHMYAPYVHRQIARLQEVIEQQLIQDALEGLGRAEEAEPQPRAAGEADRIDPSVASPEDGLPGEPVARRP